MTKFAAYDQNSIYAVENSRAAAIETAKIEGCNGTLQTAPISTELAAWIDENGWDGMRRSFEIDRFTGFIVDTTDA